MLLLLLHPDPVNTPEDPSATRLAPAAGGPPPLQQAPLAAAAAAAAAATVGGAQERLCASALGPQVLRGVAKNLEKILNERREMGHLPTRGVLLLNPKPETLNPQPTALQGLLMDSGEAVK